VLAVVNNGTHFLAELRGALQALGVAYDLVSGDGPVTPPTLDPYAGIVLTGGDVHVYEPEQLETLPVDLEVLDQSTVPILGICLGHQLIAHHYGAAVAPLLEPVDRNELVELVADDVLFAGLSQRFRGRVAHDDAVVGLSGPLVRLARSAIGEYEAIRHRTRPIYGVQFHPEASGQAGMTILKNFVGMCQLETTTR
jgi:GMP synthase (glutamine-hydrolysing)